MVLLLGDLGGVFFVFSCATVLLIKKILNKNTRYLATRRCIDKFYGPGSHYTFILLITPLLPSQNTKCITVTWPYANWILQ